MERLQVEKVNRLANHNQDFLSIVIRKLKGRNQKYFKTSPAQDFHQNISMDKINFRKLRGRKQNFCLSWQRMSSMATGNQGSSMGGFLKQVDILF